MKRGIGLFGSALLAVVPVAAHADDRDYCPTRPGLGTTPCTISPGRVSVETGLADWTREDDGDTRTDTLLIGDTLVRIGLSDSIEAQVGLTPFGHVYDRDRTTGAISRANGVGDALIGLKANLHNPDGNGFSIAAQPFVTLPVGRAPVGAGDWGAGIAVPFTFDLGHSLSLQFTPEVDAAVDEDGNGRHFAASNVFGLGFDVSEKLSGSIEYQIVRDNDPDGHTTQSLASLSFGYMPSDDWQVDIGAVAGLNDASPDVELYTGISHRF